MRTRSGSALAAAVCALTAALITGTLTAAPAAAEPLEYVALGDSFTSTGSLIGMDPATFGSLGNPSCFRSADGYPSQLAHLTDWRVTDVSCRGAHVPYMYRWTPAYGNPQLDALHPGVDLVTLQVGGNDTDVLELFRRCLPTADCTHLEAEWAAKVPRVEPGLQQLVRDIRIRTAGARVILVGYLQPFPEHPCVDIAPYTRVNQAFFRRHVDRLNAMLRRAASATGAEIVADSTPAGHSACDADRWTSYLGIDAGAVPLHPTRAGHRATAEMILRQVQG